MVRIFLLIISFIVLGLGCNKKDLLPPDWDHYDNEAVILGYISSSVDCESGYMVSLVTDPPTVDMLYALEMPNGSGISTSTVFPVKVVLSWDVDTAGYCGERYIRIKKIKKID